MRILHVITGLRAGGAEAMLLKLLRAGDPDFEPHVVSLGSQGEIGVQISELGVPVYSLSLNRRWPNPVGLISMLPLAHRLRPALIQGWMPHGNLVAALAATWLPTRSPVIWNIRMSLDDLHMERKLTRAAIRLGAQLSSYPAKIIYNSHIGARQHEAIGYRKARTVIIPNGFDCKIFRPSADTRLEVRSELGIKSDAILVGLIARYHPMKDHAGFLRAAGSIARQHAQVYFLLAGSGVTPLEPELMQSIVNEQLQGRVFLLGERSDVPRLTAALDIACSVSTRAEGFSNAVGEAMACGVPCVVTDIGDSAYIVADTGISLPPGNPEMLASAIGNLLDAGPDYRRRLGDGARKRVEDEFSLPAIAQQYANLYRECVASQSK